MFRKNHHFEKSSLQWCKNILIRIQKIIKDRAHLLKPVSAEMKKEAEITVRTFQNTLFLCCYALETSTVAFQDTFSTKSARNRARFWRISMGFRRKSSTFSKMCLRKRIRDSNIDEKKMFTKKYFCSNISKYLLLGKTYPKQSF